MNKLIACLAISAYSLTAATHIPVVSSPNPSSNSGMNLKTYHEEFINRILEQNQKINPIIMDDFDTISQQLIQS